MTALKRVGALVLGKTVTTEFAYFEPGPTRNPHNSAHTPGGRAVAQLRLWPPALSVPAGRAKNGLPLGLQCVAGWQRDEELLGWSRALAEVFS